MRSLRPCSDSSATLLILFTHFDQSPNHLLYGNHKFVLCGYESVLLKPHGHLPPPLPSPGWKIESSIFSWLVGNRQLSLPGPAHRQHSCCGVRPYSSGVACWRGRHWLTNTPLPYKLVFWCEHGRCKDLICLLSTTFLNWGSKDEFIRGISETQIACT